MAHTIVVQLAGGLGNQMFQYALGRKLQLRHGATLRFDLDWFRRYNSRSLDLYGYRLELCPAPRREVLRLRAYKGTLPDRVLRRLIGLELPGPSSYVRERQFTFDPSILTRRDDLYLSGYWQSPLYFNDIANTLRREFVPRECPDELVTFSKRVAAISSVSVHVRRGDYVSDQRASQRHGICDLDYYREASQLIADRVANPEFFVFSDDPRWARTQLRLGFTATYASSERPRPSTVEMAAMRACRHHIIANSTFSWWAAWLCSYPGKVIVAPRRWFGDDGDSTKDLIPSEWLRA
jgi:hypothetical protein